MEEIKQDIRSQIVSTNRKLNRSGLRLKNQDLLTNDPEKLNHELKRITRWYKFSYVVAMALSIFLIIISLSHYFSLMNFGNMNKSGMLILFTIVFIMNTFRFHKVKIYLQHKIFLVKVLQKISFK
ncbi:MAG TPA: hypothetical protein VE912_09820 [Bacteroidales bacterium]|nr:hypothetical protein [Bacteroidales bacterium]